MKIPDGYVLMPITPTKEMLRVIRNSEWPEDWNIAKEEQKKTGDSVVPFECNMEIAFGQYKRLITLGKKS